MVLGLSQALDTLGAQAFGTDNKKLVGLVAQRGMLSYLSTILWCYSGGCTAIGLSPSVGNLDQLGFDRKQPAAHLLHRANFDFVQSGPYCSKTGTKIRNSSSAVLAM